MEKPIQWIYDFEFIGGEIEQAMIESSENIILPVWEEIFILFMNYRLKIPSSPFKKLNSLFYWEE